MKNSGQTLVELLIAIALFALLVPALMTGFVVTRSGRAQQEQRLQATAYLKEGEEAVRVVASNGWSNLSNGMFYPIVSGSTWALSPGSELISGNLTRQIIISDARRDLSGNIIESGGTTDLSTKKLVISVSWTNPLLTTVSVTTYLTRHTSMSKLQTTLADFNLGATNSATTGVAVTNVSGGEITLGAGGGGGDWCKPTPIVAQKDLPKNGVANAISAIEGKISVGTGDNASGVSFANVSVSSTPPPNPQIQATFDGYKTNGVYGESGYAYIATDNNSKEIVIIDLNAYSDPPTNLKYKEVGSFNAPGNGSGNAISTSGNYGYMVSANKFYIFDLSSKSGSRAQVNPTALTLSGTVQKIIVIGNYAYVANNSVTNQLQIIDVSNPVNPIIVGQLTLNGQVGRDISINSTGTRAYLATAGSVTQKELFIINTQIKSSPVVVNGGTGVYDTLGMDPKGINVVTGNRVIIVGNGGVNQYQVVNINDETAPVNCGNLAVATGINGISSVLQSDGYAYSYIITGDSTLELKVILGGAGTGSNHNLTGIFESGTIDLGNESAWNSFKTTTSIPQNTTLQFKVALKDSINNSCSGVVFSDSDFVGINGSTNTFFLSSGGLVPFDDNALGYENPGRCARYRSYLNTTDNTQTPVLYDISLNYSP